MEVLGMFIGLVLGIGVWVMAVVITESVKRRERAWIRSAQWSPEVVEKLKNESRKPVQYNMIKPKIPDIMYSTPSHNEISKEEFERMYPRDTSNGEIAFEDTCIKLPHIDNPIVQNILLASEVRRTAEEAQKKIDDYRSCQQIKSATAMRYDMYKDEIDKCRLESKIIGERLVRTMRQHREETNLIMLANEFKRAQVNKSMYAIGRSSV